MKALSISGLNMSIARRRILHDISLDVEEGEYVGIVGENGAGKTSLLKCICGLWNYQSGKISVGGFEFKRDRYRYMERLGALIEYPNVFPEMTLRENIDYFGGLCRVDYGSYTEELLDLLRLRGVQHEKVKTYSSGMKQKVCLFVVLMKKPQVCIFDEPTAMLDPKSAADIRAFLSSLRKRRKLTLLISGHNLHEMETLCDRVILLEHGRFLRQLKSEKTAKKYRLEFSDEAEAKKILSRSDGYSVCKSGKDIIFSGNGAQLKQYLVTLNPDIVDLEQTDQLEDAFLEACADEEKNEMVND